MHPIAEVILFGDETRGARPPQRSWDSPRATLRRRMRLERIAWTICLRAHRPSRAMMFFATPIATLFLCRIFCAACSTRNGLAQGISYGRPPLGHGNSRALRFQESRLAKTNPRSCPEDQQAAHAGLDRLFRFLHEACSRICHHSWLAAFFGTTGRSGRRYRWKKPVVDASSGIVAVHQNHDYRHHPQGKHGVWYGEEAEPIINWPADGIICALSPIRVKCCMPTD